jgi:hypothetical protein
MLIDDDFDALQAAADARGLPVGSLAYEMITKAIRRLR